MTPRSHRGQSSFTVAITEVALFPDVFFVDSILWVTISSSPNFSSHSSQILLQVATFCSPCMRPCKTSWVAPEIYRYYDCCVNLLAVIFSLICWLEHRSLHISIHLSFLLTCCLWNHCVQICDRFFMARRASWSNFCSFIQDILLGLILCYSYRYYISMNT